MLALRLGRRAAPRWIGAGLVGLAGLVLAASGLAGCARDGQDAAPAGQGGQVGTAATATPSPTAAATPNASASAAAVLADGQHVAYLTDLDVLGRTLTFDLILFYTGAEANTACLQHQGPECPPPNDYFIVNDNPKLRTLPVAQSVTAKVLPNSGSVTPIPIAFADLPAHFATTKTGTLLSHLPFRLTVTNGMVVAMEEMFLP